MTASPDAAEAREAARNRLTGEFGEHHRTEPEVNLPAASAADWGDVNVNEGARTPWGPAGHVERMAPGMVFVSTEGHGGVKLSPQRNQVIPAALRNSSGWYEEDCEAAFVVRYHAEDWARGLPPSSEDLEDRVNRVREEADDSIKRWFPEKWETANGRVLQPGESRLKDEREWEKRHAGSPIARSSRKSELDRDYVVVSAGADEFIVPKAEWDARMNNQELGQDGRFVVDPARHPKLPPKGAKPAKPLHRAAPSREDVRADHTLTETARFRVNEDLAKRWRVNDGRVLSLREYIEMEGVEHKSAYAEGGGRRTYALVGPGGVSLKVSKATFDYLQHIPDSRTPGEIAYGKYSDYQERMDRSLGAGTPEQRRAQQARADKLYADAMRLRDAERVVSRDDAAEREAARFADLRAREQQATIQP
jgi:hypothetical protein